MPDSMAIVRIPVRSERPALLAVVSQPFFPTTTLKNNLNMISLELDPGYRLYFNEPCVFSCFANDVENQISVSIARK